MSVDPAYLWRDIDFSYDADADRSIHVPTGLAVRWLRNDPPMERRAFFELQFDGMEKPFEASYNFNDDAKKLAFPHLSERELWAATRHWPMKINYVAYGNDLQLVGMPPHLFVKVWHHQLRNHHSGCGISTKLRLPTRRESWTFGDD